MSEAISHPYIWQPKRGPVQKSICSLADSRVMYGNLPEHLDNKLALFEARLKDKVRYRGSVIWLSNQAAAEYVLGKLPANDATDIEKKKFTLDAGEQEFRTPDSFVNYLFWEIVSTIDTQYTQSMRGLTITDEGIKLNRFQRATVLMFSFYDCMKEDIFVAAIERDEKSGLVASLLVPARKSRVFTDTPDQSQNYLLRTPTGEKTRQELFFELYYAHVLATKDVTVGPFPQVANVGKDALYRIPKLESIVIHNTTGMHRSLYKMGLDAFIGYEREAAIEIIGSVLGKTGKYATQGQINSTLIGKHIGMTDIDELEGVALDQAQFWAKAQSLARRLPARKRKKLKDISLDHFCV